MIQKEYADFLYRYDEIEGYSIVPKMKAEIPSTFYKYYALTDYNVDALTNMYVYATHPNELNDPFDCNKELIEFNTWDDVRALCPPKFDEIKKQFSSLRTACDFCRDVYMTILYRKLGLVSLAPKHDNYLMWALYAQNNGFCIEFDVGKFPFQHFGPFPINYVDKLPHTIPIGYYGGNLSMLIQSNVKNMWWEYENEWRLYIPTPIGFDMKACGNEYEMKVYNFGDEHNRKFRYTSEAIKSIILGTKFLNKLVANKLSANEMDVTCSSNIDSKEIKILDFLARITEKHQIPIRLAILSDFNKYEFMSIHILKYAERKFRIINVNE